MKKIKELFGDLSEIIAVTKLDGILIVAVSTLAGMIIGMLCSPRKNAKYGCNNGTTTIYQDKEDMWLEEDDDEECLSFR